ncbi:MAG TPA: hypothetical protein V6D22_25700 [Candidatus Obscuribacterales bacterium]
MNKIFLAGVLVAAGITAVRPVLAQTIPTPMNIRCLQEPGLCGDFPTIYSMALPGANLQPIYVIQQPAVLQQQALLNRRASEDAAGTGLNFGTDMFPTW